MRARFAGRFLRKRDDIADPRWRGNPTGTFAAGLLLLATACGAEQPVAAPRARGAERLLDEPQNALADDPDVRTPSPEIGRRLMFFGETQIPREQRIGLPPVGATAFVEHFSLDAPRAALAHDCFDETERELRELWATPTADGATWLSFAGRRLAELMALPDEDVPAYGRYWSLRFVEFGKRVIPGSRDGQTFMHRYLTLGRAGADRLRPLLTDRQQAVFDRFSGPPAGLFKRPRPEDFE